MLGACKNFGAGGGSAGQITRPSASTLCKPPARDRTTVRRLANRTQAISETRKSTTSSQRVVTTCLHSVSQCRPRGAFVIAITRSTLGVAKNSGAAPGPQTTVK